MKQGIPVSLYKHPKEDVGLKISLAILCLLILFSSVVSVGIALILVGIYLLYVRINQGLILGNSVLVNPKNFPEVNRLVDLACERLGERRPRVHIRDDPSLNASATGFSYPYSIVLNSSLIKHLSGNELLFVIGHELAHIKCKHTFWLSIISPLGSQWPFLDVILNLVFSSWSRKAEYTCDRAGLMVSQDLDAAIRAILKLTVGPKLIDYVDLNEFLNQTRLLNQSYLDKFGELLGDHPYSINRIRDLIEFSKTKSYLDVVQGTYYDEKKKKCPTCNAVFSYTYKFCTVCNTELVVLGAENLTCKKCGRTSDNKHSYCPYCGERLKWEEN